MGVELTPPGDTDFVDLYHANYGRLVTALRVAGADAGRSEDIAQEAFARTFRHWERVREGINPAGYPYRVAFRLLARRGGIPATPLDDHDLAGPGTEGGVVDQVSFSSALAAMPPRRRACAALCLYLGLAQHEAAELLGIAPGTVGKQLALARRALRAAWNGGEAGPGAAREEER